MNKIILMGRLTRDPEMRNSGSTSICRYSLAVDRRFRREGEPEADFFNCTAFGKSAEFADKYFRQGTKILITGRIQSDNYTNKEGQKVYSWQVIVDEQEFAESMLHREAEGYSLPQQKHMLFSADEVLGRCANHPGVLLSMMETKKGSFKPKARFYIHMTSVTSYSNSFELLCKELRNYRNHKYRSVIVSASRTRAKRLADDLMDEGLNAYYTENANQPVYPGEVMVTVGGLRRGFDYPDARFVYISENDIFGQNHLKKKRKKKKAEDHIRSLQELSPGDS